MLKFWDHKCKESKEIGEGNNFKQNGKYTDWKKNNDKPLGKRQNHIILIF